MQSLRASVSSVCVLVLVLTFSIASPRQSHSQAVPSEDHAARISELGHRLLDAALRSNALAGPELKPWHLKVNFEMLPDSSAKKPVEGTFEEWYLDRYHWRRTYTSPEQAWSGSEWRTSKSQHYGTSRRHDNFARYLMNLRVGNPVVDPLYQVANVRPEEPLLVERVNTAGLALNCTSLAHPPADYGRTPEWIIPTMCFDSDFHLRLIHSENTVVQFLDLQPFQSRAVAREVQVIVSGRLIAQMNVTVLENSAKIDDSLLKPAADAEALPLILEPGDPQPVPVYEVGASFPLLPDQRPFRGTIFTPIVIRKDGSVRVEGRVGAGPMQAIFDSLITAVNRWRFQPYLIDGQPVEVEYRVQYAVDGKPFVPSYERAANAGVAETEPAKR